MYKPHQFMEVAKDLDKAQVSDSSIREVEETSSIDRNQLMSMYGFEIDPSGQSFLQPNTILGGLGDNQMSYDPYRLRYGGSLQGFYGDHSLKRLTRLNPANQIVTGSIGQELVDFYSEHPDGTMTFPKIGSEESEEWLRKLIDDKDKK